MEKQKRQGLKCAEHGEVFYERCPECNRIEQANTCVMAYAMGRADAAKEIKEALEKKSVGWNKFTREFMFGKDKGRAVIGFIFKGRSDEWEIFWKKWLNNNTLTN